jgi:type IV pilus assembly protein PilB
VSEQQRTAIQAMGTLTPQTLKESLEEARTRQVSPWDVLIGEKRVSEEAVATTFAQWFKLPHVRLASVSITPEATKALSEALARKYICLPLHVEGRSLLLALANPCDYAAIQAVEFASGLTVRPVVASRTEILDGIDAHYGTAGRAHAFVGQVPDATDFYILTPDGDDLESDTRDTQNAAESPPVVKMCNIILRDAIKAHASDIHLEPGLHDVQVRLRVDGVLRHYMHVPKWLQQAVVSRLKILAKLDIAERRRPQDGRIKVQCQGQPIDIRVSTLPTHFGEKVVMRLLGSAHIPTLQEMGFSEVQGAVVEQALSQPQGMLLVTGPTGAGKSTTLYSLITKRQSVQVNIVTVEDPIEYQVPGINQVQVNTKAGLTFASVLRSILRQDPDVILLGEIRDLATAEIAFQAAMTGHLVLSTLHTNSAVATITRLLDLGVDPFLITSAVTVVIAQRLVRRLCGQCKAPSIPTRNVQEIFRLAQQDMVYDRGSGCAACDQTGYTGRIGLYEILRLTPRLKELITCRASEADLRKMAALEGTRFLLEDAIDKVRQGVTTLEEVRRVIELEADARLRCPQCQACIQQDFATCPYCLLPLKRLCHSCRQALQVAWKSCPYCDARSSQELSVESTPHTLPSTRAAASPSVQLGQTAPPRGSASLPVPKHLRVLVVDDDDSLTQLVRHALSRLPLAMDIVTASDGVEALTIMAQHLPDLVISDVVMPRMDGLTLCQRLREDMRTAFVPIMLLTANTEEADRTQGYLVGTDDYVTKPFTVPDLNARIMRLLRRTYGL